MPNGGRLDELVNMNPADAERLLETMKRLSDRVERAYERYRKAGLSLAVWLAAIAGSEVWWITGVSGDIAWTRWVILITASLVVLSAFLAQIFHYLGAMMEARQGFQLQLVLVEMSQGRLGGDV